MKKTLISPVILAGLCGALLFPLAAGCGSKGQEMSKDEEKNFKGGPIPPEARAAMQRGSGPPTSQPGGGR